MDKNTDTITIPAYRYEDLIDKTDLSLTAERLEAALMLINDMQDDYFRFHEPTAALASDENAAILYGFSRYRSTTNAIADLLFLIGEDFKRLDISWK